MARMNHNLGMVLRGVGVSPGIVLATAARIDHAEVTIERVHLPESLLDAEVSRLMEAVARAEQQIDELHGNLSDEGHTQGGEHLAVLDAHKVMLRDQMLLAETERHIREQCINAEWGLTQALEHIVDIFEAMEDAFFRERGDDVQHVGDLLLRALHAGESFRNAVDDVPRGAVVIASDLSPAEALTLARLPVAAFALDHGSATSHTAIIAHSMAIPSVVALRDVTDHVGKGDRIIVDGDEGEIIVHPSPEEELVYARRARRAKAFFRALRQNRDLPATTPDGVAMTLRGNLDIVDEWARIGEYGGDGVGLFRTEFLFLDRAELPTEQEQYETYRSVLASIAPHPVTIRTLDVGGDKVLRATRPVPASTAGLRAIRYCLKDRELFDAQLRALLRASVHGQLRLLFPFISSMAEVRQIKRILAKLRQQLLAAGQPVAETIPVGFMIEVPAAALISDLIAAEADFLSVGTNDLIQYTLAVARDESALEEHYHPLHPAMLRILQLIARAARAARIDVGMCGEMAGDPRYVLILLALGFTELSMNAASIPLVKEVIRRTPRVEARALLQRVMGMGYEEEIADLVDSYMVEHFSDIVTPRMRGAPRYAR